MKFPPFLQISYRSEARAPRPLSQRQSPDSGQRGFTLLELLLVILLSMLILGLSTLFFARTLPSGRFNATVRELAATMRQARALAQITGERQTVLIDLDSKYYGIEGRAEKKVPSEMTLKFIDPVSGETDKGTFRMVFHPTGFIEGGTIELSMPKRTTRIQTDPVLGSVIIR